MNKEDIERVESYVRDDIYSGYKVESVSTSRNDLGWFENKHRNPKFLTSVVFVLPNGTRITHQLNSMAVLRDLNKDLKY